MWATDAAVNWAIDHEKLTYLAPVGWSRTFRLHRTVHWKRMLQEIHELEIPIINCLLIVFSTGRTASILRQSLCPKRPTDCNPNRYAPAEFAEGADRSAKQ